MKILLLSDSSNSRTVKWANALQRSGIEVFLFGLSDYYPSPYHQGIEIESLKTPSSIKNKLNGNIFKSVYLLKIPALNQFTFILRVQEGLANRDYLWKLAYSMIKDNPILGIGPGSYKFEMFNYFPVMLTSWEGKLFVELYTLTLGKNNSHNFYLAMFTDLGVLGFISSIMLPIIYMNIGYKTIRLAKSFQKEVYLLVIGITAAGAGMFVRGIFEGISIITYGWLSVDLPFWMIFGILGFYYLKLSNDRTR